MKENASFDSRKTSHNPMHNTTEEYKTPHRFNSLAADEIDQKETEKPLETPRTLNILPNNNNEDFSNTTNPNTERIRRNNISDRDFPNSTQTTSLRRAKTSTQSCPN